MFQAGKSILYLVFQEDSTMSFLTMVSKMKGLKADDTRSEILNKILLDAGVTPPNSKILLHRELKKIATDKGLLISQLLEEAFRNWSRENSGLDIPVVPIPVKKVEPVKDQGQTIDLSTPFWKKK